MQIVYFSHSYRKQDAGSTRYFGELIRTMGLVPSLDPPSETVNAAKLERHLNTADGMIAILNQRDGGISEHIRFEIGLCLRARKPLLVFVEDLLSDNVISSRILQRRFSRSSLIRQTREHQHVVRIFQQYLGKFPPPRYQPSLGMRTCLVVGKSSLNAAAAEAAMRVIRSRGYAVRELHEDVAAPSSNAEICEGLGSASVAVFMSDTSIVGSHYVMGATQFSLLPTISITMDANYPFHESIPREYQPRVADANDPLSIERVLVNEFRTFEEDFVELESQKEVESYANTLLRTRASEGHYAAGTRVMFQEVIMGDKNIAQQVGAQGSHAHADYSTFNQIWGEKGSSIDLVRLAQELSTLRAEMRKQATEPEQDVALGAVASAEQAAKQKDGPKVMEYLKAAGKWTFDVATKIGTSVAAEAIKAALRIN
jgi:hypothetical protein